jgi:hypothetical protein
MKKKTHEGNHESGKTNVPIDLVSDENAYEKQTLDFPIT